MQLKDNWTAIDQSFAATAEKELSAEVSGNHQLSGIKAKATARHQDQDDVLFELQDGSHRVAEVHLTYSTKPEENSQWPRTKVYTSYDEWLSASE